MRKRLLALGAASVMTLGALGGAVHATEITSESGSIEATYDVSRSYIINIPGKINLTKSGDNATGTASVSANSVLLGLGESLSVSLRTSSGKLQASAGAVTSEIPYSIEINGQSAVDAADLAGNDKYSELFTMAAGTTTQADIPLVFSASDFSNVKLASEHKDSLTFRVNLRGLDITLSPGEEYIIAYDPTKTYTVSDENIISLIENDRTATYEGSNQEVAAHVTELPKYFDGNTNLFPYLNLTDPSGNFLSTSAVVSPWGYATHATNLLVNTLLPVLPGDKVIWTGANAAGAISEGGNGKVANDKWGIVATFGDSTVITEKINVANSMPDWESRFKTEYANPNGGYYGGYTIPDGCTMMGANFWNGTVPGNELYIKTAKFGVKGIGNGTATLTVTDPADPGYNVTYIFRVTEVEEPLQVSFVSKYETAPSPQLIAEGETPTNPGSLTTYGYSFDGWYTKDGTDGDYGEHFYFNTPVTQDVTLYAKWSTPQILIDHFANKKIVVLGDSISTLAGETPSGYAVYYTSDKMNTYAIGKNTTWWGSFINNVNGTYFGNFAWSSSMVGFYDPSATGSHGEAAAMANYKRINDIGKNGAPDVILIYGGVNDLDYGVTDGYATVGSFDPSAPYVTSLDTTTTLFPTFIQAYVTMITRIKNKYPNAEIIALTPENTTTKYSSALADQAYTALQPVYAYYDIPYADMRSSVTGLTVGSGDFVDSITHPNNNGFSKMTKALQGALVEYYLNK